MSNITALPLNGYAPDNVAIANHLREQAASIEDGVFTDLRGVFLVYETMDGRLIRQTAGAPCDLARSIGIMTIAAVRGAV